MSRMSWQRCPSCGRLNLAQAGSTAACDCAAVTDSPRLDAPPPSLAASGAPVGDYARLPRSDAPAFPPPRRLTTITPEQDIAARTLLASALGEEWTF